MFVSPQKQIVDEDDNVEFLCYGSSKGVEIHWMMVGHLPLPSSAKVEGPVLKFNSVQMNSSGSYLCLMESPSGDEEITVELIVNGESELFVMMIIHDTSTYCYISVCS